MGKRFAKQLGQFIVTLFGITFLTFVLPISSRGPSYDATGNSRYYRVSTDD